MAAAEGCLAEAPAWGTVVVREIACASEIPSGGDGRVGADILLANSLMRVVIRAPETALTVLHTAGGTLLDAAPWSTGTDDLHEGIPLVGGGWLDLDHFEVTDDGVLMRGTVVALPEEAASGEGRQREVRWRIAPDDPWLLLEGADGLDLHPTAAVTWYEASGVIQTATSLVALDAPLAQDLGGALRFEGASRILVSDPVAGWAERAAATRHLRGVATGASDLRLYRVDQPIGRVPLDPSALGAFDLQIPADVTAVVATGAGLPSPPLAPSEDLVLALAVPAELRVALDWEGLAPREVRLAWESAAGRGDLLVPPGGTSLWLAPGQVEITVGGALEIERTTVLAELPATGSEIALRVRPAWDPGARVAAAIGRSTDRDRRVREAPGRTLRDLTGDGFGFTVLAPTDAVAGALAADDPGRIGYRNGVRSTHPEGWSIVSWPWSDSEKAGGWGAPDLARLDAREALQVATGAESRRFAMVDLLWLQIAPPPVEHRFLPDFVSLDPPNASGPRSAWAAWFGWLDQRAAVVPTGPVTWVDVTDPSRFGATEVEDGLVRGAVVAGTGPVLDFLWHGTAPGGVVAGEPARPGIPAVIRLAGHGTLDRVALIGEGGATLATWEVSDDATIEALLVGDPGAWVVAAGWTSSGDGDWAVTGPVWISPPG